jgi:ornithine cyclodeaminase/alanine dehydrogenase-like protein (mu-crystallin family)
VHSLTAHSGIPIPQFTEADVRRHLDPARVLAAIESAFRDRYPLVTIPARAHVPLANGTFLAMPCYDPSCHALGTKLVTVRRHPAPGEPSVQATYILLDADTAQPRLIIAANYLTDLRTAATSAIATKYLARHDASTLGIFGTGRLARTHLQLLPQVRNFQRILICGRDPARTTPFVHEMNREVDVARGTVIVSATPRTLAAESDVLCTCTSNPTPLFDGQDLRPGTHLNLVGSFQPHTREVDTTTVKRSTRILVETHATLSEPGDLLIPMQEGAITSDHIVADLHALITGKKQGRQTNEEITIFKSVGCALEDLVTAGLLL